MPLDLFPLPIIIAEYKRMNLPEPYTVFTSPIKPFAICRFMAYCHFPVSICQVEKSKMDDASQEKYHRKSESVKCSCEAEL